MEYNFNEHKHRYAVWTVARAVNRNFAKTVDIISAIDCTGLRQFSESEELITQQDYDIKQKEWCNSIINHFSELDKPLKKFSDLIEKYKCSYGRASKIIAIYLKTSVVFPTKGKQPNCLLIHPPIDRILLSNLASKVNFKNLVNLNWTTFEENDYWEIVKLIRNSKLPFNWILEEYWNLNLKRKNWPKAFEEMAKNGDDKLVILNIFEDEDFEEWT